MNRRFLFLITHYYPVVYGAELFAKQLAEYLVSQGNQVDIVTGKWQSDWTSHETHNGVHIYRVPVAKIRYLQTGLFVIPQLIKAQSLLATHSYDYIHAHIFPSLVTGALLRTKVKKIVTIQGGDLADYPEIYGFLATPIRQVISQSLHRYHKIHTVSTDLDRQVTDMTARSSIVIPNGVPIGLDKLSTTRKKLSISFQLPNTKYLAFSPSRLTNKNNLLETIKAVSLLHDKGMDIGLVIAGEGHLRSEIETLIKDLQIEESVVLLGNIEHQQVLKLSSAADVVIRVSTKEGFGISLLEGLAVGTPLVSSQAGGLADFIKPEYAYIPENHRAKAIAASIELAIHDPDKKQKIRLAQAVVKKTYTWNRVLPKFASDVYCD